MQKGLKQNKCEFLFFFYFAVSDASEKKLPIVQNNLARNPTCIVRTLTVGPIMRRRASVVGRFRNNKTGLFFKAVNLGGGIL